MDDQKYNYMEQTLKTINADFVSLVKTKVKENNEILHKIINTLVENIKSFDLLFEALFSKLFYGGSFYDGLKVSNPEEFDLDLLLRIPVYAAPVLTESDVPGYLYLQITQWEKFIKQPEFAKFCTLKKLMNDSNFILQSKVRRWIEGLVNKVLEHYPRNSNNNNNNHEHLITVALSDNITKTLYVSMRKSGPTITLRIKDENGSFIDVDLVPAFTFFVSDWPGDYKKIEQSKQDEFFVVPKPPNKKNVSEDMTYWRPSFQVQERKLLKSLQNLKPAIRLLKKMRDNKKHKQIASYYIKTIFLHRCDEFPSDISLSGAFMKSLKIYADTISTGEIRYYWNEKNNLIEHLDKKQCENIGRFLQGVIKRIDNNINDPMIIARELLNDQEFKEFEKKPLLLGKKFLKRLEVSRILKKPLKCGAMSITKEQDINKLVKDESFRQNVYDDLKRNGLISE